MACCNIHKWLQHRTKNGTATCLYTQHIQYIFLNNFILHYFDVSYFGKNKPIGTESYFNIFKVHNISDSNNAQGGWLEKNITTPMVFN